jgi:hypothetical protein
MNFLPAPHGAVMRGSQLGGFLSGSSNAVGLAPPSVFGSTDFEYDNAVGYNHGAQTANETYTNNYHQADDPDFPVGEASDYEQIIFMRRVNPRHVRYSDVHGICSIYALNAFLQKQENRYKYGYGDRWGRTFATDFLWMGIQSSREVQDSALKHGHRVVVTRIAGRSAMPDLTLAVRGRASAQQRKRGLLVTHNSSNAENTFLWVVPRKRFDTSDLVDEFEMQAIAQRDPVEAAKYIKLSHKDPKATRADPVSYIHQINIYLQLEIYHSETRAGVPPYLSSGKIGSKYTWASHPIKIAWINFQHSIRSRDPQWFGQARALLAGSEGRKQERDETLRALPRIDLIMNIK